MARDALLLIPRARRPHTFRMTSVLVLAYLRAARILRQHFQPLLEPFSCAFCFHRVSDVNAANSDADLNGSKFDLPTGRAHLSAAAGFSHQTPSGTIERV